MLSHIGSERLYGLPEALRRRLIQIRHSHNWTQAELGQQVGLPQAHISGIESGKVVPRFNTLLDLVRVLDSDLLLVPRSLVPAVQSLIRDHHGEGSSSGNEGEQPLYATDNETDEDE